MSSKGMAVPRAATDTRGDDTRWSSWALHCNDTPRKRIEKQRGGKE
nr:MAG TPA: hypothetical protein [Caudoviricetes sp.]